MPSTPPLWSRLRGRADRFIHHPVTDFVVVTLIVGSVAALLAEPAFPQHSEGRRLLEWLGHGITWVFITELGLRWWVAPRKRHFFRRYWLDLLAVLPMARPLRLLRVLRLLRLFRAGVLLNRRMRAFSNLLRGSVNELTIVATLSLMIVLAAALIVHNSDGAVAVEQPGIRGALWFAIYTLVSGEPHGGAPVSELGRLLTLGLMVGGLTVFGVFVGAVSAAMSTVLSTRLEVRDMELDDLVDHIVVCGWNPAGPTVLRELNDDEDRPRPIVVITESETPPPALAKASLPEDRIYYHSGDYTRVEVLQEVGISRASTAILLTDATVERADTDRDARTVLAALTVERLSPGIFCCAELVNQEHSSLLKMAHVEEVVVRDWYAGVIIGSMGRNRGLAPVLNDILTARTGNAFRKVIIDKKTAGQSISALHQTLKQRHQAILVGWERAAPGEPARRETLVNPPGDQVVQAGDVLVVISESSVKL